MRAAWSRDPARRRAWRRYWLHDPLFGLIDYALHYGLRLAPIALCSAVGCALGVLAGRYRFAAWSARARDNLRRLRPELADDAPGLDAAIARMWCQIGRVMTEFSVLHRLWPERRVTLTGAEHVTGARAGGRPVLVMGLHLANWEVIMPRAPRRRRCPFCHTLFRPHPRLEYRTLSRIWDVARNVQLLTHTRL